MTPGCRYILDGFLGLYGLISPAMFIKEKFFSEQRPEEPGGADYAPLVRDPERGRNRQGARMTTLCVFTSGPEQRTDGEYKELPARRERQRKNDQVYQGLSAATRDTYDSLQMQPLPPR
ncbi:T-cell surface glycoprotein CD3 zeta chain-like [Parambassis ranga]|uniref:T-cell surface glycoprotein CD3 zeta chain n=1 Tax=Parambassis ranga TaxID=210632 RepID=A0A6P7HSA4_9TELE|nr:T-cell surface glycoprotein CD3 zeta chain-like [Parambassis ranga]